MATKKLTQPRLDNYEYSTDLDGPATVKVLLGFQILFFNGGSEASLSLAVDGEYLLLLPKHVKDDSKATEKLINSPFWRFLLAAIGHANQFEAEGRPAHRWVKISLTDL